MYHCLISSLRSRRCRHGVVLSRTIYCFYGLIALTIWAFALGSGAWGQEGATGPADLSQATGPHPAAISEEEIRELYDLQKLLVDTIDQVERNYVTKIDRRKLVEAAIRGILQELDPYSSYIPPEELDEFRGSLEGQFGGVGLQVGMEKGRLQVISPLPGTPAYRAGIMAGDVILEVEGKSTAGMTLEQVVRLLKGEPGTSVRVKIQRSASRQTEELTLVRELIHVPTVLGFHRRGNHSWEFWVDPSARIAYVRVTVFGRETAEELKQVLQELSKDGIAGLILDLRFNPGGILGAAIRTADLFLTEGMIVKIAGRNLAERAWEAHPEESFPGFPMVVLVNRFSASGSEIVAGALQDHQRAAIAGERTWGKGSVQNVIPLEGAKSALKLTTASYYRPSGKKIHRLPVDSDADDWGVVPDPGLELRLTMEQMAELIQEQRLREIRQRREVSTSGETQQQSDRPQAPEANGGSTGTQSGQPPQPDTEPENQADSSDNGSAPSAGEDSSPSSGTNTADPEREMPREKDSEGSVEFDLDSALASDPQLRLALEYLRTKIGRKSESRELAGAHQPEP